MAETGFSGRTVIVTGAGSGIGREAAQRFVDDGAWVLGADVDPAGIPDGAHSAAVDVRDEAQMQALVARAVCETGRLDVMCNNAGIGSTNDVASCTVEEWDGIFAVNARGTFLGTKYAVLQMLNQRSGCIVNTASVVGVFGVLDRAAYSASKGAIIALTKQVATQYAPDGIRCNCVCPGTVDSPWVGRLLAQADDPVAMRERLISRQPLGRLATPGEIAEAIVYLASDSASFVTGSAFFIDGGLTAGMSR